MNQILDNLEYDSQSGCISFKEVRYILVRPETIMALLSSLEEELGERAGQFFYQGGMSGGRLSAQKYKQTLGLSEKGLVEFMISMGTQIGWGRFELVAFDMEKRMLEINVHNSPYAQAYGPSQRPVCHVIRGVLAGLAQGIFERPVQAGETGCLATGNNCCRFLVKGV
ncbi:MAG: V4R domain-containing protein [Thermodesulfobacteriota bacterium]